MTRHPVVLAITGASGAPYGVRLLEVLARNRVPVWLVTTTYGLRLLKDESGIGSLDELRAATGGDWSSVTPFPDGDRGALPASGSQRTSGMVDLSLFDGYRRRHRRGHQPLPGRARRRRHAEGAAAADPRSAGDAAVPDSSAESGDRDRGRRGRDSRIARASITVPRTSPSWWTSSSNECWIISTSRSSSPRAGPATSHEGPAENRALAPPRRGMRGRFRWPFRPGGRGSDAGGGLQRRNAVQRGAVPHLLPAELERRARHLCPRLCSTRRAARRSRTTR